MRRVLVVYDFVSPLTFVAHERVRRLWRSLPLEWAWVPWETAPHTPPRAPGPQRLDRATERLFAEQNLPFKAAKVRPNTNLALRAALWCEAQGGQQGGEDFRDRTLRRLYERGLDIDHADVLAGLVESIGLDPIAFLDDMKAGAYEGELRANEALAKELGVRTVPTFVMGTRCVAGDVDWPVLDDALRQFAAR